MSIQEKIPRPKFDIGLRVEPIFSDLSFKFEVVPPLSDTDGRQLLEKAVKQARPASNNGGKIAVLDFLQTGVSTIANIHSDSRPFAEQGEYPEQAAKRAEGRVSAVLPEVLSPLGLVEVVVHCMGDEANERAVSVAVDTGTHLNASVLAT